MDEVTNRFGLDCLQLCWYNCGCNARPLESAGVAERSSRQRFQPSPGPGRGTEPRGGGGEFPLPFHSGHKPFRVGDEGGIHRLLRWCAPHQELQEILQKFFSSHILSPKGFFFIPAQHELDSAVVVVALFEVFQFGEGCILHDCSFDAALAFLRGTSFCPPFASASLPTQASARTSRTTSTSRTGCTPCGTLSRWRPP